MKTRAVVFTLAMFLALGSGLVGNAGADLINVVSNGGFEDGPNSDGLPQVWSTSGSAVLWSVTGSGLPSHNGDYYIDMSSNWGEIYQYITTTPGATYTVEFYVGGIVDGGLKLAVYAGANTGQIFTDYITEDDPLAERNANGCRSFETTPIIALQPQAANA